MSELVPIAEIVWAEELLQRWGIEDWELDEIVRSPNGPKVYSYRKSRRNPEYSKEYHYCSGPYSQLPNDEDLETIRYYIEGVVFNIIDVKDYESRHPELLHPVVSPHKKIDGLKEIKGELGKLAENLKVPEDIISHLNEIVKERELPECISGEELRKLFKMSPIQFVDFLNRGILPSNREEERREWCQVKGFPDDNCQFYITSMIPDLFFYWSDINAYEEDMNEETRNLKNKVAELEMSLNSANDELALLRGGAKGIDFYAAVRVQEIESLKKRVAELENELSVSKDETESLKTSLQEAIEATDTGSSKPSRTTAATTAASANRVEEWKKYAALMVKVAVDCGTEGPKERKRSDLQTLAKRHGAELPQVALDVLRDALPEDHVSRKAGAPRQG